MNSGRVDRSPRFARGLAMLGGLLGRRGGTGEAEVNRADGFGIRNHAKQLERASRQLLPAAMASPTASAMSPRSLQTFPSPSGELTLFLGLLNDVMGSMEYSRDL